MSGILTLPVPHNLPLFILCNQSNYLPPLIDLLIYLSGGSHTGIQMKRTGFCGLGSAIQTLGLRTSKPLTVDYVVCLFND